MTAIVTARLPLFARLVGTGIVCLGLIGMPATFDGDTWEMSSKTAFAKKGGDKGGGKDRGGGRDRGDRGDRGNSAERSAGAGGEKKGNARGSRSLGEVFEGIRSGNGFGFGQKDRRIDRAKDRYGKGAGQERHRPDSDITTDPDATRAAHRFSAKEAEALIGRGWKTDRSLDGFANHGERVRTMVELAKALGYGASVGALQANFGTAEETGIAALQEELATARAEAANDPDAAARIEGLEADLAAAIRNAKPGQGPIGDWASADLDVNDDGIVDRADLAALGDRTQEEDGGEADADDETSEDDDQEIDDTVADASSS